MTLQANIQIDLEQIIGEVHDHLYGANQEQMAQSGYGGHWAEMLHDRKFAGNDRMYVGPSEGLSQQDPSFGVVVPWEAVNPHYHNVLFVHDNTTYYTGRQSQRITIRQDDGEQHGIRQAGLYLQAGNAYLVRLVLKGVGQAVTVQLGDQEWVIPAIGDAWQTFSTQLTPTQSTTNGVLAITIQGEGSIWIGCASVMPADNLNGHRSDVVAAIKEWTPTFLRWPGGNFASAYHWMDGIGDMDKRPSYLDPVWRNMEPNDIGTHEFIDLCRLIGSEPILTINIGNGTVEEAAAWVEYCNGDASTKYGAMRAENGSPEPFNVKTWFVGNEQFGNWQVGHVDAETYARLYLDFARAMRDVDPDLLLLAVGAPTDLYGHWNELVLKIAADEMDELSVHYYSIRTEKWDVTPELEQLYLPKVAAAHEVAQMLDDTLDIIAKYSDPPVPLAFDEWNTYFGGKAPHFFEDYTIADAVYTGALMNACLHRCDRVKMSAVFNLINVMGNYRVTPTWNLQKIFSARGDYWVGLGLQDPVYAPSVWKTPSTLVMELMTHHRGEVAVGCAVEGPTISTPAAGNLPAYDDIPMIDAAATYDKESGMVYVSLVNRDMEHDVQISLEGLPASKTGQMYIVQGDAPNAMNTDANPQAVQIESSSFTVDDLSVPPHSFVMLTLSK